MFLTFFEAESLVLYLFSLPPLFPHFPFFLFHESPFSSKTQIHPFSHFHFAVIIYVWAFHILVVFWMSWFCLFIYFVLCGGGQWNFFNLLNIEGLTAFLLFGCLSLHLFFSLRCLIFVQDREGKGNINDSISKGLRSHCYLFGIWNWESRIKVNKSIK